MGSGGSEEGRENEGWDECIVSTGRREINRGDDDEEWSEQEELRRRVFVGDFGLTSESDSDMFVSTLRSITAEGDFNIDKGWRKEGEDDEDDEDDEGDEGGDDVIFNIEGYGCVSTWLIGEEEPNSDGRSYGNTFDRGSFSDFLWIISNWFDSLLFFGLSFFELSFFELLFFESLFFESLFFESLFKLFELLFLELLFKLFELLFKLFELGWWRWFSVLDEAKIEEGCRKGWNGRGPPAKEAEEEVIAVGVRDINKDTEDGEGGSTQDGESPKGNGNPLLL